MRVYELGEPIAEREFLIRDANGNETTALARIGRPQPDQSDWVCPYEIVIAGKSRTFRSFGADSLQALVLAMKTVDVELEARAKELCGVLLWLGTPHHSVFDPERKLD